MGLRNRISTWVVRKIIKSQLEDINNPGFLVAKIGPGDAGKTVRKVYLSENLLADIENSFKEKHGEEGVSALYKVGKRKGNRFMNISEFPKYGEVSKKNLMRFFRFFSNYVEIVYSDKMSQELDLETQTYSAEAKEFSICRKNGKGYILCSGTPAGALSYLFSDKEIETAKTKCEGRGDEKCVINVGKPGQLEEEPVEHYPEIEDEFLSDNYDRMNKVRETKYSETSLANVDGDKFDYDGEKLAVKQERHIIVEVCMIYFLEQEAQRIGAEETLFKSGFREGERLAEGEKIEFAREYFSALGWGDIKVSEDEFVMDYFPWMPIAGETDFNIIRGLISGMMSEINGRDIEYREYETDTDDGFKLTLKS